MSKSVQDSLIARSKGTLDEVLFLKLTSTEVQRLIRVAIRPTTTVQFLHAFEKATSFLLKDGYIPAIDDFVPMYTKESVSKFLTIYPSTTLDRFLVLIISQEE